MDRCVCRKGRKAKEKFAITEKKVIGHHCKEDLNFTANNVFCASRELSIQVTDEAKEKSALIAPGSMALGCHFGRKVTVFGLLLCLQ